MPRKIVHFSVCLALLLVFACESTPSRNKGKNRVPDNNPSETDNRENHVPDNNPSETDNNKTSVLLLEKEFNEAREAEDFEKAYFLLLELIAQRDVFKAWDYYQITGLCLERDLYGNSKMSHDNILDAARHFEEALRQHSNSDTLHFAMAQYLFGLMTLEERISHPYGAMQATGERAMESIKNALSHGAQPSECHYVEGNIYRFQNNFLDAIEAYRLSVEDDPLFILAYEAGFNVSMELDYPDQAKSWLKEGIERNPSSYELANLLAHHLLDEGKQQKAVDVMEAYLKRNSKPARKALYDYGYFLEKNKDFKQAITSYQKAIDTDSLNLDAYYRLGNLYERESEWKKAYQTFSELLKHLPLNHAYRKEIRRTLETLERKL